MSRRCNLILDSCCDLPYRIIDHEGMSFIPFPYVMSDGDHLDDMYQSITPEQFYGKLRAGEASSTSQISLPTLMELFEDAAKKGEPTVYLCFSSNMSGSYDVACMAVDNVKQSYPDAELYVADSGLASFAEGLLAHEAIRQWNNGLTARELKDWAEEARYYVNCRFVVEDLEALARGGRLPAVGAYLGSKLDIKPLVSFDQEGKLTLVGVVRGRKKAMKQMVEFFQKNFDPSQGEHTCVIGHADCADDLQKLREKLEGTENGDQAQFIEGVVGPVIGSHVGPGMMAVCFWGPDRRSSVSLTDRIARRVKSE
ncbi:MAG: DegV family protein [Coriobacteriia bacterium]|nr:DegV family protein [Coriobacteriia bacterium]